MYSKEVYIQCRGGEGWSVTCWAKEHRKHRKHFSSHSVFITVCVFWRVRLLPAAWGRVLLIFISTCIKHTGSRSVGGKLAKLCSVESWHCLSGACSLNLIKCFRFNHSPRATYTVLANCHWKINTNILSKMFFPPILTTYLCWKKLLADIWVSKENPDFTQWCYRRRLVPETPMQWLDYWPECNVCLI